MSFYWSRNTPVLYDSEFRENFRRFNSPDSLHSCCKMVIGVAQKLALFPVSGVNHTDTSRLKFYWLSKQMLYTTIIIIYALSMDALMIIKATKDELSYHTTVEIIFLATLTLMYFLFIQMGRNWPKFAKQWEETERIMAKYGRPKSMKKKFKIMLFSIFFLALGGHVASAATKVVDILACPVKEGGVIQAYFLYSYRHVFSLVEYNWLIAVPLAFMSAVMECAWSFTDLFIITMAIAMAEKYKQMNKMLLSLRGNIMPSMFWRQVRETYNELAQLTKMLDRILSPIILLSFANNLIFICLQLFNSLKPMISNWHVIYFIYSFSYLVLRTCAVSLYASAVYEQSKESKNVLFSVPSESYCVEVARFLIQVTSDELALTGCRFFSVTRTLVLTVAGTIVTYEIVLVQFNSVGNDPRRNNSTFVCG